MKKERIYRRRKNYGLLRKLAEEKRNPVVDTNIYLYHEEIGPDGKLEAAHVIVAGESYSAYGVDNLPWLIS